MGIRYQTQMSILTLYLIFYFITILFSILKKSTIFKFYLLNINSLLLFFRFLKVCLADGDCSCAKTETPRCIHDYTGHQCKCLPIRKHNNLVHVLCSIRTYCKFITLG